MPELELPHNHGEKNGNLIRQILQTNDFQILADNFKMLGDNSRIRIFWILCHQEECVTNLSALLEMTTPAVSHHLKLLRSNGLITSKRDGKEVYYKAANTKQAEFLHHAIENLSAISCPMDLTEYNQENKEEKR